MMRHGCGLHVRWRAAAAFSFFVSLFLLNKTSDLARSRAPRFWYYICIVTAMRIYCCAFAFVCRSSYRAGGRGRKQSPEKQKLLL